MGIKVFEKGKNSFGAEKWRYKVFGPKWTKGMLIIPGRGEMFRIGPDVGVCVLRIGRWIIMDRLRLSMWEPGELQRIKRDMKGEVTRVRE